MRCRGFSAAPHRAEGIIYDENKHISPETDTAECTGRQKRLVIPKRLQKPQIMRF